MAHSQLMIGAALGCTAYDYGLTDTLVVVFILGLGVGCLVTLIVRAFTGRR